MDTFDTFFFFLQMDTDFKVLFVTQTAWQEKK